MEILYRGRRVDNGEWVEGHLMPCCGGYVIAQECEPFGCEYGYGLNGHEVDPASIGQYVGMRDKNGKRIFKGDVVKKQLRRDDYYITKIEWTDCGFMRSGVHGVHPIRGNELEVIGTIHDTEAKGE